MPAIRQLPEPSFVEIDGKYYIENVCFDGNKFTISDLDRLTFDSDTIVQEIMGLVYYSDAEHQEALAVNTTPTISTLGNTITLDEIFAGCKIVYTYTKEEGKDLIKEELYLSDAVKAALPLTLLPNIGLLIKITSTLDPTIDDVEITDISLSTGIENSVDTTTQINYKKTAEDNPRFWFETGIAIDSLSAEETIIKKYFDEAGVKYLICGVSNDWLNASVGEVIIDPTTGKTSTSTDPVKYGSGSRNIVTDSNDRIHMVYFDGINAEHTHTDNEGSSWSLDTNIAGIAYYGTLIAGGDEGTDLHLVVRAATNALWYFAYSSGAWQSVVIIHGSSPLAVEDSAITLDDLVYVVSNTGGTTANIYIANHSLSDHTAAFSTPVLVSDGTTAEKHDQAVSNVIGNKFWITWRQMVGSYWQTKARLYNTTTKTMGSELIPETVSAHQVHAQTVIESDGTVHLFHAEMRGTGYWDIKHVWSDDDFASSSSEWLTTEGLDNDHTCYYISASIHPLTDNIYVLFSELETPNKLRLLEWIDESWGSVIDLSENSTDNLQPTSDVLIPTSVNKLYYAFREGTTPFDVFFNSRAVAAGSVPLDINNIAQGQSITAPTLAQKIALILDNINQSQTLEDFYIEQFSFVNTDFEQSYINLLLKQYWQQTKAPAEIRMQASTWQKIVDWLSSFLTEFDLDNATGDRLDIIGRIVGMNRIVPLAVPKIAFGFSENDNARGFDDKFLLIDDTAPFADKFERAYTDLQLDDNNFRFFIRAKISKNIGSPYLADDDGLSMQEAINTLFSGEAYIVDRKNMKMVLWVTPEYNADILRTTVLLNLLPKPHGVKWAGIILASPNDTFGFSENLTAQPFANKFDTINEPGGRFAEKILIQ